MMGWGHGVLEMNGMVTHAVEENLEKATHQPYVESLFAQFRHDGRFSWRLSIDMAGPGDFSALTT
jgi:hypothetical protein